MLVVDDDVDVLEIARELLMRAGFHVLTAGGGAQALALFRVHAQEIDLVILDLHMPEVDGDATFREIRQLRSDARVVIVSGYPERMTAGRFEATRRADGYLAKPYLPDALIEQVRGVLAA